ncbi:hypothetical protein F4778DRAFT_739910 [Xylariomycetidae sp. FL2044]|nr:hypothetical protein F4778DRAFT_739910 [Xylariomycetidae sp. FL2044]
MRALLMVTNIPKPNPTPHHPELPEIIHDSVPLSLAAHHTGSTNIYHRISGRPQFQIPSVQNSLTCLHADSATSYPDFHAQAPEAVPIPRRSYSGPPGLKTPGSTVVPADCWSFLRSWGRSKRRLISRRPYGARSQPPATGSACDPAPPPLRWTADYGDGVPLAGRHRVGVRCCHLFQVLPLRYLDRRVAAAAAAAGLTGPSLTEPCPGFLYCSGWRRCWVELAAGSLVFGVRFDCWTDGPHLCCCSRCLSPGLVPLHTEWMTSSSTPLLSETSMSLEQKTWLCAVLLSDFGGLLTGMVVSFRGGNLLPLVRAFAFDAFKGIFNKCLSSMI